MKALTLHQPWASLVALGVKTIETRSWSTSYRGPLAIHAAKTDKEMIRWCNGARGGYQRSAIAIENLLDSRLGWTAFTYEETWGSLPLGAIVATCELVEVVPILAGTSVPENPGKYVSDYPVPGGSSLWLSRLRPDGGVDNLDRVEDQRSYGNFRAGRFAWVLDGVRMIDPPVPYRGRQRLWAVPNDLEVDSTHRAPLP